MNAQPYSSRIADPDQEWNQPRPREQASNKELGRWGEDMAARHLQARGIEVLDRNWRSRWGEIDLVCWDAGGRVVFACEVKTRRVGSRVPAIESMSRAKVARLRTLLAQWLSIHEHTAAVVRIDFVAITVDEGLGWHLCHIEGVA